MASHVTPLFTRGSIGREGLIEWSMYLVLLYFIIGMYSYDREMYFRSLERYMGNPDRTEDHLCMICPGTLLVRSLPKPHSLR